MNQPDTLIGQLIDGRWRILDRLGEGGMGVVYRAERIKLGKLVAIKFLDARAVQSTQAVARFEREARAISRVQHRHSVSILDFGVHQRRPYIVMEYLAGSPLGKEMGKPGMTPARGVQILIQMLEALRHAHDNGVVHRDLKPDNVMIVEATGAKDFVKILDFGLARIISLDEPSISVPQMVAGTPSYMSPEQARGERVDHRTDLYSAGVILYGMCTGRKPFRSEDAGQLLDMHKNAPPPLPRKVAPDRNISPALEQVILRSLEKNRDDRYADANAFLDALKATPEFGSTGRKPVRRRTHWRAAMVVVVLVGLGAAGALAARDYLGLGNKDLRALWSAQAGPSASPKGIAAPSPPAQPVIAEAPAAPVPAVAAPTPDAAAAPEPVAGVEKPPEPVAAVEKPPEPATPPPTPPVAAATRDDDEEDEKPAQLPSPPADAAPADPAQARVASLLEDDKLADAERQLRAEAILQPRAGWVHLALGEVYFRRLWRADAIKEWTTALALDSSLKHDPRLLQRLCATLGHGWKGTGERLMTSKIGTHAIAPMNECIRTADDLDRVRAAVRVIERVGGRSKLQRDVVAARMNELSRKR